jgi:hypothetical protein
MNSRHKRLSPENGPPSPGGWGRDIRAGDSNRRPTRTQRAALGTVKQMHEHAVQGGIIVQVAGPIR